MSWSRAAALAQEKADRYERKGRKLATVERREAFRRALLAMDQPLLVEWLHNRLGQEFMSFAAACLLYARADQTIPDIPSLKSRK